MRLSSVIQILDTMLETAVVVRAQFMWSRAYKDVAGMAQALEMSFALDQDLIAILNDAPFEVLEISGKRKKYPIGTPDEIIEAMRATARIESASLAKLIRTVPGQVPEIEERNKNTANRKMDAVGNFFRRMRKILKENWPYSWSDAYQKEFAKFLRMHSPKRRHRK